MKDSPEKVVNLMLKRQVEQGNKEDVTVFEKNKQASEGGFIWEITPEYYEFWRDVIINRKFHLVPDEPSTL